MIYQLKIVLQHSEPPIWRRIEVPAGTLLEDLHYIIQTTMGWTNSHLHDFRVGKQSYREPSEWDDSSISYIGMKLKDILSVKGRKIIYEYDFGDSWSHELTLERIVDKESGMKYPRCIEGKRACPPEDCGGMWGYMELQGIMKDENHEEYEETLEWLGGEFDSEKFDLELVNKLL